MGRQARQRSGRPGHRYGMQSLLPDSRHPVARHQDRAQEERRLGRRVTSENRRPLQLVMRVGVLCLALILVACGKAAQTASVSPTPTAVTASTTADSPSPVPSDSPSAASSARTIPPPSPCSPSAWPTYKDSTYKFSVSYPPCFTFEQGHGSAGTGLVMTYRAYDPVYKDTYPAGQLEIAIYTKDATTLSDWMTNHSGPAASTKVTTYFPGASNRSSVTVDGKPGISLDWLPNA